MSKSCIITASQTPCGWCECLAGWCLNCSLSVRPAALVHTAVEGEQCVWSAGSSEFGQYDNRYLIWCRLTMCFNSFLWHWHSRPSYYLLSFLEQSVTTIGHQIPSINRNKKVTSGFDPSSAPDLQGGSIILRFYIALQLPSIVLYVFQSKKSNFGQSTFMF